MSLTGKRLHENLSSIHISIAEVLIGNLKQKGSGAIITYSELCNRIGCAGMQRNMFGYLKDLSEWVYEMGAPMISLLVINEQMNRSGKGLFGVYEELYGVNVKDLKAEQR